MSDDLPIVHVQRPPLPWRLTAGLTECGLPIAGHPVISREELIAKVKGQGQRRSQITTCQTCWDTARRWPTWGEDPVMSISREVSAMWGGWRRKGGTFKNELLAIAALIERHREEFDELLEDITAVVKIDSKKGERAQ